MGKTETTTAFSSDRFKALINADFTANKSNYLKLAIGTVGVFLAIALLISIFTVMDINSLRHASEMTGRMFDEAIHSRQNTGGMTYFTISMWVISIGMTIFGSLTFSNLSTKRSRISAFMIPASQVEKFTLRLLTYLVAGTIVLLIGFLFGFIICQIAFGGAGAAIDEILVFINQTFSGSIVTCFILMAILGNSLYSLGSSLWPKLSWIKTWVICMVVEWVGALLLIIASLSDFHWISFFNFCEEKIGFFKWGGLIILVLLNITCWVLAWRRYKTTQIIQRFMTK